MATRLRSASYVLGAALALTLVASCTASSDDQGSSPGARQSSVDSVSAVPSESLQPRPSATASSDTRSDSSSAPSETKKDRYIPPKTAPYPTPSGNRDMRANQTRVLKSLPGSPSATCVAVAKHTTVRAGSIAAGNFQTARQSFSSQFGTTEVPQLNLYVIPKHAKAMKKLTVTVKPLGGGKAETVSSTQVEKADQWRYYAVELPVVSPGEYRLSMVSGADKGCFNITFAK